MDRFNLDRFKWRIWDKEKNEYIDQMDCFYWDLCFWYEPYNEDKEPILMDIGGKHIPEQCTGLKDKNGNLIYEGDILEVKWNNDDYPRYYEVNFEEGAFGIKPLECNDWLDSEYISDISQATLIIGNIHENKDLLEEK